MKWYGGKVQTHYSYDTLTTLKYVAKFKRIFAEVKTPHNEQRGVFLEKKEEKKKKKFFPEKREEMFWKKIEVLLENLC